MVKLGAQRHLYSDQYPIEELGYEKRTYSSDEYQPQSYINERRLPKIDTIYNDGKKFVDTMRNNTDFADYKNRMNAIRTNDSLSVREKAYQMREVNNSLRGEIQDNIKSYIRDNNLDKKYGPSTALQNPSQQQNYIESKNWMDLQRDLQNKFSNSSPQLNRYRDNYTQNTNINKPTPSCSIGPDGKPTCTRKQRTNRNMKRVRHTYEHDSRVEQCPRVYMHNTFEKMSGCIVDPHEPMRRVSKENRKPRKNKIEFFF